MEKGGKLPDKHESGVEKQEMPEARDILLHFNKEVYPGIKEEHHPDEEKRKRSLIQILKFQSLSPSTRSYKQLGIETAKGITNFVLQDKTNDLERIQLFLEVMWVEMTSTAYANSRLDFKYASDWYLENGQPDKASIITECLKLCDKKFWKGVATLTITDNHVIIKSGHGTTIQSKKDFLGGEKE